MRNFLSTLFQLNTVLASKIKADRLYAEGQAYIDSKEHAKAFPILKEASEAGHKYSPALIGFMLMKGEGTATNWVDAVKYFELALEREIPNVHFNVGMLYGVGGYGLKRNLEKAEYHLRQSKAVDNDPAADQMIEMIQKRKGPFGAKEVSRPKLAW